MGRAWILSLALAACAAPALALDGTPQPFDQAPAAVKAAAATVGPRVDWKLAFRFEPKGEAVWYNVGGFDPQGRLVALRVGANGEWRYARTTLQESELPEAVTTALATKAPGLKFSEAEGYSKDAAAFLFYRVLGTFENGKRSTYFVSLDGQRALSYAEAVAIYPEGSFLPAMTSPVTENDIPAAVKSGLAAKLPNFAYSRVSSTGPDAATVEFYRFDGDAVTAVVRADGARVYLATGKDSHEILTLDELPPNVRDAMNKLFAGASWDLVRQNVPEQVVNASQYIVRGVDPQRRQVFALIWPSGEVFQSSRQISADALPAAIRATLLAKFPDFRHFSNSPQALSGGDGAIQCFIFHGSAAQGEQHFVIESDGRFRN